MLYFYKKERLMNYQADIFQTTVFLQEIIKEQVNDKEQSWIEQQEKKLQNSFQLYQFSYKTPHKMHVNNNDFL
jgi:hypothetical protein